MTIKFDNFSKCVVDCNNMEHICDDIKSDQGPDIYFASKIFIKNIHSSS